MIIAALLATALHLAPPAMAEVAFTVSSGVSYQEERQVEMPRMVATSHTVRLAVSPTDEEEAVEVM